MTATVLNWRQKFLTQRRVNKMASAAMEECWRKVQVKAEVLPPPDVDDYIRKHSAAAVHRHVDSIIRENPSLDGGTANMMIVKASERLANRLVKRLSKRLRRRLTGTG